MIPVFTKRLLKWNRTSNTREMPWKFEKDPYKIWLSEIILQQTRVDQGWDYYEKFIIAFPNILLLANAPEKKVFKLWEGLGYYKRCKNLIETARKISDDFEGRFPSSYEEIVKMKGVGPYTAAAIASFAFNLPYAVVDGNVQRILARYFGISTPIDTVSGKRFYQELAVSLLDKKRPGIYNQAIMDFGAVICKPRNPLCNQCVQQSECIAFKHGWINELPVKEKRIQKITRWLYYFVIQNSDKNFYIRQRKEKDIWQNLYEFVLWETDYPIALEEIPNSRFVQEFFKKQAFKITGISKIFKQQLTHQTIQGRFIAVQISKRLAQAKDFVLTSQEEMKDHPFPKFIAEYLLNPL
jgi:A/G-specific adenine glycosylase